MTEQNVVLKPARPTCERARRPGDYPALVADARPLARVKFLGVMPGFGPLPAINLFNVVGDAIIGDRNYKDSTVTLDSLEKYGFRVEIISEKSDLSEAAAPIAAHEMRVNLKLEFSRAQLALLDMLEDQDWEQALTIVEGMAHRLRVLAAEQRADAAGVVKTG